MERVVKLIKRKLQSIIGKRFPLTTILTEQSVLWVFFSFSRMAVKQGVESFGLSWIWKEKYNEG
jgi:hypothetical protein